MNKRSNKFEIILKSAIKLSEKIGRENITFKSISDDCGVTIPSIVFHFKSINGLRESLLGEAMKQDNEKIVLEALMYKKLLKNDVKETLKEKIIKYINDLF